MTHQPLIPQPVQRRQAISNAPSMLERRTQSEVQPSEASPLVGDVLRTPGEPLDASTRAFFEGRMGAQLASVPVRAQAAETEAETEADTVAAALLRMAPPAHSRPGFDLGHVRVHADEPAARSARELNAFAYAYGHHLVFDRGEYRPDTQQGKLLLAHELAHLAQQDLAQVPRIQTKRKEKTKPVKTITQVTLLVDRGIVVLEIDRSSTLALPTVYNGKPSPGSYRIQDGKSVPALDGIANSKHWVVEWNAPPDATYRKAREYIFNVVAGRLGPAAAAGMGAGSGASGSGAGAGAGSGAAKEGSGGTEGAGGVGKAGEGPGAHGSTGAGGGPGGATEGAGRGKGTEPGQASTTTSAGTSATAPRLTPEEERVWRLIANLMRGANQEVTEDPAELVRLFQVLRSVVIDPQFSSESGESWIRFARFLDQHRDKIQGFITSSPKGKLTEEILEKIVTEYDKFLASEPEPKRPGQLESPEDYEKEFRYDPGWQRLSVADRKLLIEYARAGPGELSDKKIEFSRVTTEMKISMALKLSDTSLLGEVGDVAKRSFTDPKFLITLVVVMAIYVALWLTPDPSLVTKIAAGALTVALLIQFAIEDIYGFAVAWSDLIDDCTKATTIEQLKAAGNKLLKSMGQIGFDIMLFLVMWRIGKLAGPKLSKIGAERGVKRASADVTAAEARPGSGVSPKTAGNTAAELLSQARNSAPDSSPGAVLDALGERLPKDARDGLARFRAKAGDAKALKAVEGQAASGRDLGRFLREQAMTPEAVQAAKTQLADARLRLARAKLVQAETIKDPALRETVRQEQYEAVKSILEQARMLETAEIKQALAARDPKALARALRKSISQLGEKVSAHKTQGALGESIQRALLRIKYAGRRGVQFVSNLALVRKLGQYKSIRDWTVAEEARIRSKQPGISDAALNREVSKTRVKLFEKNNQVYQSIGEVDTLVAEPGAGGKLRPLEIAEAKAGGATSASEAGRQLSAVVQSFERIAAGEGDISLYELTGDKQLGKDMTQSFDLSQTKAIEQTTYGPEGRTGFSSSLGFTDVELKGVAESLIKNLPPEKPATIPPVTTPRKEPEAVE